jgi:predicted ArsR family transcriptional regulator
MVTIVIPEEKLSAFASAFLDEKMRVVIFFLQDGPMTVDGMAQILKISQEDVQDRIDKLRDLNLVRRTSLGDGKPEIYSLEFSMEKFGGFPKPKTARILAESMSDLIAPFLEKYGEEIGSVCDTRGIALGRGVEQLLLSAFSRIMDDLKLEMQDEDRRICEKFDGGAAKGA